MTAESTGPLLGEITRWLAAARADGDAQGRSRQRWLRQQAEDNATLGGLLLDLAERGLPVVVAAASGRRHRGRVRAVGEDFLVLGPNRLAGEVADGVAGRAPECLLTLWACGSIRTEPGVPPLVGDRPEALGTDVTGLLQGALADRPVLTLTTVADETLTGELRTVGVDLVTLRLTGPLRGTVYVPVAAIAEIWLDAPP